MEKSAQERTEKIKQKQKKKTEKDTNKHPAAQTRLQDRQTNKTERINK